MTMRMSIPIEERTPAPSLADRAVAWSRLFLIEFRRSPAIPAALAIAAVTAWLMWRQLPVGVVRWGEVSDSASHALLPASAIAAGIAAFVSGRDERLRLDDQLAQTSVGTPRRDVLAKTATLAWCLAGYLIVVAGFFLYAMTKATWAGPTWSFVTLTIASIVLGVAVGWLIGTIFRNRLSPIVAIAAMLGLHAAYPLSAELRTVEHVQPDGLISYSLHESRVRFLLPYEMLDFYDLNSFMLAGHAWIIGLAIMLASIAWWFRHKSVVALLTLSVAAMISGIAAVDLLANDPRTGPGYLRAQMAYVDPACEQRLEGRISICLHPQDEALLPEAADAVERLVAPVAGFPGVPSVYENQPAPEVYGDLDRLVISFYDGSGIPHHIYSTVIRELLHDPTAPLGYETGSAQWVIATWLLQEAGVSPEIMPGVFFYTQPPATARIDAARADGVTDHMELEAYSQAHRDEDDPVAIERHLYAAVARFLAMPDDERRAWLEANWDALRSGHLTLEDLP